MTHARKKVALSAVRLLCSCECQFKLCFRFFYLCCFSDKKFVDCFSAKMLGNCLYKKVAVSVSIKPFCGKRFFPADFIDDTLRAHACSSSCIRKTLLSEIVVRAFISKGLFVCKEQLERVSFNDVNPFICLIEKRSFYSERVIVIHPVFLRGKQVKYKGKRKYSQAKGEKRTYLTKKHYR